MYNTDLPNRAELPGSRQLVRSTCAAMAVAAVLLVTVVLPAEYAIDPTGIGRQLGLTQMGEIKVQLGREAAISAPVVAVEAAPETVVSSAPVEESRKSDRITLTLQPGEATEVKMEMKKGGRVDYRWETAGGVVNYDTHGDSKTTDYHGYAKGKGVTSDQGVLEAAFDGKHGWFWRNRDAVPVTLMLDTKGEYSSIKKVL
jgi:hypothetical protein